MKLQIDKDAETPVHLQLREQIIFLISTGQWAPGSLIPSVRELELRLKVHRNTVSHVYSELEREGWLVKRPGSLFAVLQQAGVGGEREDFQDLDDLINRTIDLAQKKGYSLQQLAHRVRRRLMTEPPDHLLLVEPETGMGEVMKAEISAASGYTPASSSVSALLFDPSQAIGAILLIPAYLVDLLDGLPAKYKTSVISLGYSDLYKYIEMVGELSQPSVVGMISVSTAGLKTMTGLIAPALGSRHSLCAFVMTIESNRDGKRRPKFSRYSFKDHPIGSPVRKPSARDAFAQLPAFGELADHRQDKLADKRPSASASDLRVVDFLLCDTIAYEVVVHPKKVKCQLLTEESLQRVTQAAKSLTPHRGRQ